MAFGLPADAAPGGTLAPDAAAVLHGTDETGPILAICAHHLDIADLFADLVTDLVDGGLTVYVGTDPGGGVEARCELHVPGDDGAGAVVHGRRVSGGEIVVGASDLLGDADCLAEIGDVDSPRVSASCSRTPPGCRTAHACSRVSAATAARRRRLAPGRSTTRG